MNFNTLTTDRLILREITPAVYEYVFSHYPDDELKHFFGAGTNEELDKQRDMFQKGLTTFNKTFLFFHLVKKGTAENIGWCGYHTWYTQHSRAEMGYVITNEAERNKGYMKEALVEIIRYGFNEMDLHRIEAFVGPNNTPSLKLITSLGFVKEGCLREHYFVNGKHEDSVVFSLLKAEYTG